MSEPLKPWQSPNPGDVWVLTQGHPSTKQPIIRAWTFYEDMYEYGPLVMSPNNSSILSGYRIWPTTEPTDAEIHAAREVLLALVQKRDTTAEVIFAEMGRRLEPRRATADPYVAGYVAALDWAWQAAGGEPK